MLFREDVAEWDSPQTDEQTPAAPLFHVDPVIDPNKLRSPWQAGAGRGGGGACSCRCAVQTEREARARPRERTSEPGGMWQEFSRYEPRTCRK
ncbi:unnamed protein product [Menidia menidia]|uniref:(Atlantic silverside) hypothetical protein n=1 Tax=Menidia menidia TaxID=238744 RepID=A0A8S4AI14_9TELE|nr:unnamed protein product [Menidia menidia]